MRIAAAVLMPVCCLGVVELGLRVAGFGYPTGFFLKREIEGTGYLVPNRLFTHRFFPAALARDPLPMRMLAEKPAGTYRIFLFGESAAYGDPDPAYGVGRFLEGILDERYPETDFEVVNVAVTAINSHVILPIARDCARRDGDLWVVYMGNNEMVGPFGAGTIFGEQAPKRALVKALLLVRSTRLGQLLTRLVEAAGGEPEHPDEWRGIEMFSRNQLRHDDPGRMQAYRNFRGNLEEIVETGLRAGVPVLLSTVASNLRDCAPFVSLEPELTAAEAAEWERHYRDGRDLEGSGLAEEALGAYLKAAAIDAGHAGLQFGIGTCRLALGETAAALAAFTLARDYDALVVRADTRINGIIRDAIGRHRDGGLIGLDAAALLAGQAPDGIPGRETFYEHVHFTVDGNYRLARLMADRIGAQLPSAVGGPGGPADAQAEFDACAERLAYTLWDQKRVWNVALDRVAVAPFTGQSNHGQTTAYFRQRMHEVDQRTTRASWGEVRSDYERALGRHPDDTLIRWNYAQFLERSGRLADAIAEGQEICKRLPHAAWPHYFVGSVMAREGRPREAAEYLRTALRIQPDLPFAREELERLAAAR